MKKIMTAFAAVALCGAVSADVTSANTVGYITATVAKSNYKTFSVTLTDCSAPNAAVRIDKLLSGEFANSTSFDGSDQIWRWDTKVNKWAKYSYSKLDRKGEPAWRKFNYGTDESFSELTDDDVVEPGETFMFFRAGDDPITVTVSGQVRPFGSPTGYTVAKSNYIFMAYPWPVEIKISDLPNLATWTDLTTSTSFDGSDQVWRWDTSVNKWAKYSYSKLDRKGEPAWRKFNYATDESFSEVTDADKLLAGEGFLFFRAGDDPITVAWKALEK